MNNKIRSIIAAVGVGSFMSALDSGAVNLAMPLIRTSFGSSLSTVEWIVTVYLLIISSLLLSFGRLADLYGHKRLYSLGFAIFIAGSALCGLSVGIVMLIVCRVIQALGAGMIMSIGPAIITDAVPGEGRGKALSMTAIAVALGLTAGPAIGGALATFWGWQSIFFINVPVGAVGLFLVNRNIPKDERTSEAPFDLTGSVLLFAALLLFLLPLSLSGDYHIPAPLFWLALAAALALVGLFIVFESRVAHPMLDLSLFRNRIFAASNAAAVSIYIAQFMMIFLAPFYLQGLRGYTALASGLLYLPLPITTMFIAPISGAISDKADSKYISAAGSLVTAVGLALLAFMQIDTPLWYIVMAMIVTGLGFGMFQTPNNSAIMGNVPPQNRGTAAGTLATMRNVGMALGVAISGSLFSFSEARLRPLLAAAGQTAPILDANVFTLAMRTTFLAAAGVAVISMIASLVKGNNTSTNRREARAKS